jgi:hypothetical protein
MSLGLPVDSPLPDGPESVSAGKGRAGTILFGSALAIVTGLVLLRRFAGFDPPSLWLDDQWVALLVRKVGLRELLELKPTVPLGLVVIEKLFACLSPDPEGPLQLFPLLCSVAQIPLMAILVLRGTGSRSLALLGAALLAVDPIQIEYAVRVKQYASDTLVVLVLLLVGAPLLARWSRPRAIAVALGSVAAVTISFPSVLVSLPLLHLGLLGILLRPGEERRERRGAFAVVVAVDLLFAATWFAFLRSQGSGAMRDYWEGHYLPSAPLAALRFLVDQGWGALRQTLPPPLAPALALVPVGLFALLRDPARRWTGALYAACWAGLAALSALRLYPLGGGRTDAFLHPVTILLLLSAPLAVPGRWRERPVFPAVTLLAAVVILAALLHPSVYRPCGDALAVRKGVEETRPGDALIVYPHAAFAAALYAPWPIEVVPWPEYAHGFHVRILRPETLTLSPRGSYWIEPGNLDPELISFLATPRRRILYLAAGDLQPLPHARIVDRIVERGYHPSAAFRFDRAGLFVFEPGEALGAE